MTTETPSQSETLRELDQLVPPSDPLAPRPHRTGPTGKRSPDLGGGLLPDDDSFSEATSNFRPSPRGRAAGKSTTTTKPVRPSALPTDEEVTESTNALAGLLLLAGGMAATVMPVTGLTLVKRSEMASKAILDIARTNPAIWKYLKWLAAMSKYEELGNFTASMVVAVGVDAKVMNPNGMFPQQLLGDVLAMFAVPPDEVPVPESPNGHAPAPAFSHVGADSNGASDA